MGRLIDADKLKQHYSWWGDENQKIFDDIVDLQPTEPSGHWTKGEAVTCKNCKHWNGETKGCKRNPSAEAWLPNDYCSYAELSW